MKTPSKKLNFAKQTLRSLTINELAGVVGGLGGQTWGPMGAGAAAVSGDAINPGGL